MKARVGRLDWGSAHAHAHGGSAADCRGGYAAKGGWMKKSLLLVLLAASLAMGQLACSTNAPFYSPRGGEEGGTVFVLPFDRVESKGQYVGTTDFGILFSEYLAGALQERGIAALALGRGAEVPEAADLVVRGALLDLDPGSWNLRFFPGCGAGRAFVKANARLEEPSDGRVVYENERQARSLTWQFQENILRRVSSKLTRALAAEIAREVRARPSR